MTTPGAVKRFGKFAFGFTTPQACLSAHASVATMYPVREMCTPLLLTLCLYDTLQGLSAWAVAGAIAYITLSRSSSDSFDGKAEVRFLVWLTQ